MLFAMIFPPTQRACNFDTSTDQTVSSAIVCDYMETTLFTISGRLQSYGNQPLGKRKKLNKPPLN